MALRSSLQPQPHQYIGDFAGRPLDNGMVYFGEPNKDPEFYPINIYSDSDLTTPLSQPVRTKGGFMYNSGKMTEVYASQYAYSVKIVNNYGAMVFYEPRMERISIKDSIEINTKLDVAGSVTRTQGDKNSESISLLDFIPPSEIVAIQNRTSTYDCSVALAAAVATGKRVVIPEAGTYKFIEGYDGHTDFDVVATTSGVTFDLSAVSTTSAISNGGSVTSLTTQSNSNITQGSTSYPLAGLESVKAGDWLCFFNPADESYSSWRPYYKAGEWKQVAYKTVDTLYFTSGFYASYGINTLDIYKLNSVKCHIENIHILQNNLKAASIRFYLSSQASDKDMTFDTYMNACLAYSRCVSPESTNPRGRNTGAGTGGDYGIIFGNCQHARIYGGDVYGTRHAVALGGGNDVCAVPTTDFRCYDATLSNNPESSVGAADMHGNTRDSSYERCKIAGGTNIGGGDRCYYIDCDIETGKAGKVGFGREIIGGDFGWLNCRAKVTGNPRLSSGRGIFDFGVNDDTTITEKTTGGVTLNITNLHIDINNFSDVNISLITYYNRGFVGKFNSNIDGVTIHSADKLAYIFYIKNLAGVGESDYIVIDNIKGNLPAAFMLSPDSGFGSYINAPMRLMEFNGALTGTARTNTNVVTTNVVTTPIAYPKAPSTFLQVKPTDATSLAGATQYTVMNNATTFNAIRARITAPANYTAELPVTVFYKVGLQEC